MNIIEEFGFLPYEITFIAKKCEIQTLKNYAKQKKKIEKYVNRENFLEPPLSQPATMTHESKVIKKRKSKMIAWMYQVPPSHLIELDVGLKTNEEARVCESGFIIHLLGYLYGCRLQFKDWFLDGFVPWAGKHNIHVTASRLNDFLMNAVSRCFDWEDEKIKEFNRILFMHTRSPGYRWDWERFMVEYAVFDSMWRLDYGRQDGREPAHSRRMKILCEKYNLFISDKFFKEIIDLRNDLFHDAKWDGGFPCMANGTKGFRHANNLRRLNQRLICAFLEFKTDYIKTDWTCIGQFRI